MPERILALFNQPRYFIVTLTLLLSIGGAGIHTSILSMEQPELVSTQATAKLFKAALRGSYTEVVQALEEGAEISAPDRVGDTPLHDAVRARSLEIIQLLLECGADTTALGFRGTPLQTLLYTGMRPCNRDILNLLLKYSCQAHERQEVLNKLLIQAARLNRPDYIELLADAGATNRREGEQILASARNESKSSRKRNGQQRDDQAEPSSKRCCDHEERVRQLEERRRDLERINQLLEMQREGQQRAYEERIRNERLQTGMLFYQATGGLLPLNLQGFKG
jgi:hypothetical protein